MIVILYKFKIGRILIWLENARLWRVPSSHSPHFRFLNSTFWSSYRSQSSASVEELLNNKDCSVEKLLEDDDCLQEFKNLNDKLIQ